MTPEQINTLIAELTPMISTWVLRIVGAIVGFLVARMVAGWGAKAFRKMGERAKLDATLLSFLTNVVRWSILGMAIVALLGIFGIETTSFAAAIGAIGLAVGLAFQGSLSNIASGVMLLIFRPFKVGDFIKVAGEAGTVAGIELMATTLDTPDRRRIIVPNANVFGSTLENVSHHPTRRVDVDVGVDYSADLDKTREILMGVAKSMPDMVEDPAVVLTGLGASSVDYQLRVFVPAANYWPTKENLTVATKKALDDAGIGIPFPQMDVHFDADVSKGLSKGA